MSAEGEADEPIRHSCELPDDVGEPLVTSVFEVVGYIDKDGKLRYSSRVSGRMSEVMGLAQMALFDQQMSDYTESDEPDD